MNSIFNNVIPIYLQIVEKIKSDICLNIFKPGYRLASVRELAMQLKVNPNTIQKALQQLEEEKVIFTESTNGKYITTNLKILEKMKEQFANDKIKRYLEEMQMIGFSKEKAVEKLLEKVKGSK